MSTLADSEDHDKKQHNAAFYQDLLRLFGSSFGIKVHDYSEISNCDPIKYTTDNPFLIVSLSVGNNPQNTKC